MRTTPTEDVELLDAADPSSFTYAAPSDPLPKRLVIRTVEAITGQRTLRSIYMDYRREDDGAASFWANAVDRLRLQVEYDTERLMRLPRSGPVVVVANHPFGVIDGIVLGWLVEQVRSDFKILVNSVLARAEEARPYLLPIDFAPTELAKRINLKSRADARAWLEQGRVVVVFPGGTVSTAITPLGRAYDPEWKPFTARLIARSRAKVLPVYFAGQNSRAFQVASLLHPTLRTALFFHEARNKMTRRLPVRIGDVLDPGDLPLDDPLRLIRELRQHTYGLGGQPDAPLAPSRG